MSVWHTRKETQYGNRSVYEGSQPTPLQSVRSMTVRAMNGSWVCDLFIRLNNQDFREEFTALIVFVPQSFHALLQKKNKLNCNLEVTSTQPSVDPKEQVVISIYLYCTCSNCDLSLLYIIQWYRTSAHFFPPSMNLPQQRNVLGSVGNKH